MAQEAVENKRYYSSAHDQITVKRFNSPYPIRRRTHREMYQSLIDLLKPGSTILDAGCGEGTLSILLAEAGFNVVGVDLSKANIEAARNYAEKHGDFAGFLQFEIGDAENLPFDNDAFDYVVSNHVLEHLPSFTRGLSELQRVSRRFVVAAIPTCLNPAAWALLGGDSYWKLGKRSLFAVPFGLLRVLWAALTRAHGVDEGYGAGSKQIHIFRFPDVLPSAAADQGMRLIQFHAQTLTIPYINIDLSYLRKRRFFRNFGLGTVYLLEKIKS